MKLPVDYTLTIGSGAMTGDLAITPKMRTCCRSDAAREPTYQYMRRSALWIPSVVLHTLSEALDVSTRVEV